MSSNQKRSKSIKSESNPVKSNRNWVDFWRGGGREPPAVSLVVDQPEPHHSDGVPSRNTSAISLET
eukprot:1179456-Prorocentrum_minimum.AAC.3